MNRHITLGLALLTGVAPGGAAVQGLRSLKKRPKTPDLIPATNGRPNMPWTPDDAERHTHKATTPELKELWAKVANERLDHTGDEAQAIREANAVVARQAERS
jgi:hypothetical protein